VSRKRSPRISLVQSYSGNTVATILILSPSSSADAFGTVFADWHADNPKIIPAVSRNPDKHFSKYLTSKQSINVKIYEFENDFLIRNYIIFLLFRQYHGILT
jgi:hypothetical protein